MLQRLRLLTHSRWFVRSVCERPRRAEWNSIKHFTQVVRFPPGSPSKVPKQFACFSFSVATHEKSSRLLWLRRACVVANFSFSSPSFFKRGTAELHQSAAGETRSGARENGWGSSEMMKQAVCAAPSPAFDSIIALQTAASWIGFEWSINSQPLCPPKFYASSRDRIGCGFIQWSIQPVTDDTSSQSTTWCIYAV